MAEGLGEVELPLARLDRAHAQEGARVRAGCRGGRAALSLSFAFRGTGRSPRGRPREGTTTPAPA